MGLISPTPLLPLDTMQIPNVVSQPLGVGIPVSTMNSNGSWKNGVITVTTINTCSVKDLEVFLVKDHEQQRKLEEAQTAAEINDVWSEIKEEPRVKLLDIWEDLEEE